MYDDYPDSTSYQNPHDSFKGIHEVTSASNPGVTYSVDLDIGECSCQHGKPWTWVASKQKWVKANWCSHKMRAIASIIDAMPKGIERQTAQAAYNKLLGERYIIWESVSAFHKELRRGDREKACYWALSVAAHRGLSGVARYMLNILFEESRDISLYLRLIRLCEKGTKVTYDEVMTAVRLFCIAPKKWELEPRLEIFLNEMRGYKALAKDYTYEVAKGSDIIDNRHNKTIEKALIEGLLRGDPVMTQYGLKGLWKSKAPGGIKELRIQSFNILTDALNQEGPFEKGIGFKYDEEYAFKLHELIMRRYTTFGDMGYHELNALCDALTGEQYPSGDHLTPANTARLISTSPTPYAPVLGAVRTIPLYALDNHNHRGKHLMRKWGATELLPGAEQKNLDFRWCGAYFGVAWRMLAYSQHGSCEIAWGDVKWNQVPWLYKHVNQMFY
jgi:hypothetical protein